MLNLLLQTTIEADPDDWSISRFSRLASFLSELRDGQGRPVFRVTSRDRSPRAGSDPVLSTLHESGFNQLWLFAVDGGDGLAAKDYDGIDLFWRRGGGLMITRDHTVMGGPARCNSGKNGDFQRIRSVGSIHPVMRDRRSATGVIQYLPAHPHENPVSAPPRNSRSRVIAEGQGSDSGERHNIAVAFERCAAHGRAIVQSTFHHFADYNWDPSAGCPSFVAEAAGDGMTRFPDALRSTKQYAHNIASWLSA